MSGCGVRYNRQLHPDQQKWIKDNAAAFVKQQGITVGQANNELTAQADRQVQNGSAGAWNQSASAFLGQAHDMPPAGSSGHWPRVSFCRCPHVARSSISPINNISRGIIFMLSRIALSVIFVTASLTGCTILPQPTHYVSASHPEYDPAVSARIRVLSTNASGGAAFRPAQGCYKGLLETDDQIVKVNDGFWAAWKYSSKSETVGMPPSPRDYMRVESLKFKDLIREYIVPAEKPLTVLMSASGSAGNVYSSCRPPAVMFTPTAGQDYDVFMDGARRSCWIAVRHIDGHGMDEPVLMKVAPKCSNSAPVVQGD
ncbi:hypothetical protein [Paraburkholderia caffeinilytica]|uniref:hypothetical protein n=1 Tax=Paraburkholderia caffeinilytica TaxID=1761016 RepID=UPI0038B883A8